jgi:hypothetical protein
MRLITKWEPIVVQDGRDFWPAITRKICGIPVRTYVQWYPHIEEYVTGPRFVRSVMLFPEDKYDKAVVAAQSVAEIKNAGKFKHVYYV